MPRRPRLEAAGAIHHVVVQSASDGRVVVDDADRLRFLDELRRVVQEYSWECVACSSFYTVLNPVAAGLCAHPGGFPWSSYCDTADAVPESGLLAPGLLLSTLDDNATVARGLYRSCA